MKRTLFISIAFTAGPFLQAQVYTQTYTGGNINGVSQVQTSTSQVSPCPGIITFTGIPAGVNVDSVIVTYDFFSTLAGFQSPAEQRSYINCTTTGMSEASLALAPPAGPGVTTVTYTRTLLLANGPVTGNLTFELHAGTTALIPGSCTGSGHWVVNNTWVITVYTSGSADCPKPTNLSANPATNSIDFDWTPGGSETDWEYRAGPEGTALANMAGMVVSSHPVTIGNLDSASTYDFYVRAICGPDDSSQWAGPLTTMTDTPVCVAPTNGQISGITETEATVEWQENGYAIDWELEYGFQGFTLGSGTFVGGAQSNPWLLQGLTPDTAYEVYVRSNCGLNMSDWLGPLGFSTILSTELQKEKSGFRLYPNPVVNHLHIETNKATEYSIYDPAGQCVTSGHLAAGQNKIILTDLANGCYVFRSGVVAELIYIQK